MTRHVDDIKHMIFEEPAFDNDDEEKSKTARRKERKKLKKQLPDKEEPKKSSVETIVFHDPRKRRRLSKSVTSQQQENVASSSTPVEFDLEKARFDVHKFGIKGFEKSKYEDARINLAVKLGAKPPKQKFINYRELLEQNRAKKIKEKDEAENARLLGDIFQKNPNNKQKSFSRSRQNRIGQGDVGSMRFSSVGKFKGGVLKLTENDITKVKSKAASSNNRKRLGKKR